MVGLGGVAFLVGADLGTVPWWSVGEVLVVCVCYATAPFIAANRLADVPAIGVVAVALSFVAAVYAPIAWLTRPDDSPPVRAWLALIALGLLCTAIAFIVFFQLIGAVGPARATLITFVNPAVAVIVGSIVLDEEITVATLTGFLFVLVGCWLATSHKPKSTHRRPLPSPASASWIPRPPGWRTGGRPCRAPSRGRDA